VSDSAITFTVLAAVIVLFVSNRLPVEAVGIGACLTLFAAGVLDLDQALAGFGDQTVIFIATLFVVSFGLEVGGVTAWAGQKLTSSAKSSKRRLLLLMMLMVAVLTALISVNGAVAALLPVVVVAANRLAQPPSRLLMPLCFAAFAGSMLTLTGSPVNVLVSDAAQESTGSRFGFFEFSFLGVPLLAGTIVLIALLGERLLPLRTVRRIPRNLGQHGQTLVEQYELNDGVSWLHVRPGSPLIGTNPGALSLLPYEGLTLVSVQSTKASGQMREAFEVDDVLLVRGPPDAILYLARDKALGIGREPGNAVQTLLNHQFGLAEVVIPPRSELIGQEVFPGMVTESGELIVLAVQRRGEDQGPGTTRLSAGDSLLIRGAWEALNDNLDTPDLLLVDSPEEIRRQALPIGAQGKRASAILIAMVVLLAAGVAPPVTVGLLAAGAMVLLRVLTLGQAYRGINWTTVVLVGAMIPLSTAMRESGAAEDLAEWLVYIVGDSSPYLLLGGLFVLTAGFSQLISSTATALITIPVGLSAAAETGVSPEPILMCLAVAAASSFLTPVATPVNLMVMGPGGYEFGDYWRLGLPLLLLFMAVGTFFVPVIWAF
jgi:di/tricarboxylate transporter